MRAAFYIEHIGDCTKFTNDSEFDVIISAKPRKPKRKIIDYRVVQRGTYLLVEETIDLKNVYISFLTIDHPA